MPSRSSRSAGIRWADPEGVARAVEAFARALRAERAEVRQVYWYGSWVSGNATPSSDVDLCVIVSSEPRRPRDRLPDYLPDRFPTGVDLVVLTEEEFQELEARAPAWHRAIVGGRDVLRGATAPDPPPGSSGRP